MVCNNLLSQILPSASLSRDSPRLFPVSIVLQNVPWCEGSVVCLTVQSVKDTGEVSSLGVLQIKLLGTFIYKLLCEDRYVFIPLGYISRSRISGSYGNSVFNVLRNYQTGFQSDRTIYCTILPAAYEGSNFSTSSSFVIVCLFYLSFLVGRSGISFYF